MPESIGACTERERLLSAWIESARCFRDLLDWQLDALKSKMGMPPGCESQIPEAGAQEAAASRAYHSHIEMHKCR